MKAYHHYEFENETKPLSGKTIKRMYHEENRADDNHKGQRDELWCIMVTKKFKLYCKEGRDRRGNNPSRGNPRQEISLCHGQF